MMQGSIPVQKKKEIERKKKNQYKIMWVQILKNNGMENYIHFFKYLREIQGKMSHTRYQILSQPIGIMRIIVGQAYWQVITTIPSKVKYIRIVILKYMGIKKSMLAWSVDAWKQNCQSADWKIH